ncbi:MAG: lipid-binding SYLF domain-containing protein [Pseudomonadota bacterium]
MRTSTSKPNSSFSLRRIAAAVTLALGVAMATPAAAGDRREEAIDLINDAAETTAYFAADTAFEPLWNLADRAKAMVIIPEKIRAGFIIGGSAGDAVMVARNKDGTWSQPTFLTVGSLSFGFQAGGEASELILLVMTEEGMESLLTSSVKLGGDISIAAGPLGAGAKAQTTDILAFARSRGLYGGLSLEGSYLKSRRNWNKAYYDADVTPNEVIVKGDVYNPASARLQNAVWRLANRDAPPLVAPAISVDDAALDKGVVQGAAQLDPSANIDPVTGEPYPGGTYSPPAGEGAPLQAPSAAGAHEYEDDAAWGEPIAR